MSTAPLSPARPVAASPAGSMVDPRGPRFVAAVTAVVLALVLLTGSVWLLAAQTAVFAIGAFTGLHRNPYTAVFRRFVRPRLAPPTELEASAPPRFAQGVGFAFALLGTVALAVGATTVGLVAAGFALAAAFLNAAFGFCLGCEMYLIGRRVLRPRSSAAVSDAASSPSNLSPNSKEVAA
jgi:hypothetical protein